MVKRGKVYNWVRYQLGNNLTYIICQVLKGLHNSVGVFWVEGFLIINIAEATEFLLLNWPFDLNHNI